MKALLIFILGTLPLFAHAWVATPTAEKEHHFVYRMKDTQQQVQTFEFSSTAPSYEEAYEKAAKACYTHFRDQVKQQSHRLHLNEDQGLDIIDVCANPRSI